MKLQIVHVSDIHLESNEDVRKIKICKMVDALAKEKADDCIVVFSGDLVARGENYDNVTFLQNVLCSELVKRVYPKKSIRIACVPGNHDIDFHGLDVRIDDVKDAYKKKNIDSIVSKYLDCMSAFKKYANRNKCFMGNSIVSRNTINCGGTAVNFVLVNSAPLSLLGGSADDMGMHYLSESDLEMIDRTAKPGINILVCHHSIEWFNPECKEKLRKIISKKYALVITGHEHLSIGDSRNTNKQGLITWIQGNALKGEASEGNGFNSIILDLGEKTVQANAYSWQKRAFVSQLIACCSLKCFYGKDITVNQDYLDSLSKDEQGCEIKKYFVFPSFSYNKVDENEEVKRCEINTESELYDVLESHQFISITGGHKSGKSVLAKRLMLQFLEKGKVPLLISAYEVNKKKIENTIKYVFEEQYSGAEEDFEIFNQLENEDKVVIIDDANLIESKSFKTLVDLLKASFGKVILIGDDQTKIDLKQQVVDAMVEPEDICLSIKPFLYVKRKKLIANVLLAENSAANVEKETKKINELINVQVKYFSLDPEFIINFVRKYESDRNFQFSSGLNVFNVVYESSIRNRIINNSEDIDAQIVLNCLRELAFYMHFGKMNRINLKELTEIINAYGKEYRQSINVRLFLTAAIGAKVLVESGTDYFFADRTLLAYFVAQALNQKNNQDEDIREKLEYLLRNLCFGINSDIILFLSLITNNPKFLNIIVEGAKRHFAGMDELSFDKENVKFILDYDLPVKQSLPTPEERDEREKKLDMHEEKAKISDFIELANEYDYSEEDYQKLENKILVSLKYIEILAKALPAFCHNLKAEKQDELVQLLYECPNKFLYSVFEDISNDYEGFCNSLCNDISEIKKEKELAEVHLDSVKRMIGQMSAIIVVALYQLVGTICTSEQTIEALNAFDISHNTNYQLQNLNMVARLSDVDTVSKKAQKIFNHTEHSVIKSMVRFTTRDFLLRNNLNYHGEAQSLIDCVFKGGPKEQEELKRALIQKKKDERSE